MRMSLEYQGRSGLRAGVGGMRLDLRPNLRREPVAFDAPLASPLRFREAMSALHEVVVCDLRHKPRDRTAYETWKKEEAQRERQLRDDEHRAAKADVIARRGDVPADLETRYRKALKTYWGARQKYANYLLRNDPALWRMLMPCDPVVTVAPDVVLFEGFSADESSYGCLSVSRERGFGAGGAVQLGTTNVDYSLDLYEHFQSLRSYRETRLTVDPACFGVATQEAGNHREEKIDLPATWLRGFMNLQAAMMIPARKLTLDRGAVYSLLAWLRRHKARKSPRALRFELVPGKAPRLVLEPWEEVVETHGAPYEGPSVEPVRVWGRQRLLVLARLLPLADSVDVHLAGTGLPSFWVVRMGEMSFTLGLSGWTTNDWSGGSALELLNPPVDPSRRDVDHIAEMLRKIRSADFATVEASSYMGAPLTAAALNQLARTGQVIHDLAAGVYRWRQVMPMALGEEQMGPENPELVASRDIVKQDRIQVAEPREAAAGRKLYTATLDRKPVEMVLDSDGRIRSGKCPCSHHYKNGLRAGPCRHLLALRERVERGGPSRASTLADWYQSLWLNV